MYTAFYGLKERPFNLIPSSRFLYLGETHREGISALTYGVLQRKGFGLLTGEVGTGKTTIIHALIAGLDKDVQYVHLSNPLLSPREFLDYLARKAMGREAPFESKAEFLVAFETFLGDCLQSGKNFLLIIDEAHKLSFELLEEIRLLSNMETSEEKLINIFLVGQPELRERLSCPRCKALLQRIAIHYHLRPLDLEALGEYVYTRLRVAGAREPDKTFPESVIEAIYECSKGYPREINNVSDNVLLLGYVQDKKRITTELVKECWHYMRPPATEPEEDQEARELSQASEASPPSFLSHSNMFTFALLILGVALGLAIGLVGIDLLGREADTVSLEKQKGVVLGERLAGVEREETIQKHVHPQSVVFASTGKAGAQPGVPLKETEEVEIPATNEEAVDGEQGSIASDISSEKLRYPLAFEPQAGHTSWRTVTVQEGDTLRDLALDVYGQGDPFILDRVKEENAAIENVNVILVGQKIHFPPLSVPEEETDFLESGT